MSLSTHPTTDRVLLRGISWATFQSILADAGDRPIRLTYDRGDLEIVSPGGDMSASRV